MLSIKCLGGGIMIPLELFDYTKYKEVDMLVTKYVNKNLEAIIRVLIDILNDDCDFDLEGFLPRDYLERKPKECRKLVDELYELVKSDVLRDYIKPKYEYLLYTIISWWDDIVDKEEDLLPNALEGELLSKIENEESYISEHGGNYVLRQITSFESYYYICFYDHDFLPDQLTKMVTIYLRNSEFFNAFFPSVDLNDYIDLMPCDLRELYLDKCKELSENDVMEELEMGDLIVCEILYCLQSLESRVVEIENRDEVEISNDIYDSLTRILKYRFGIECTREMTIGRANKKLGETDLYLYKNDKISKQHIAIIENKYIINFQSQYQQLLGYLNQNFKFGVTISINKEMKLEDAFRKVERELNAIRETDNDFKIIRIYRPYKEFPYVIKSHHIIPEDSTREMPVYHLILNLYDLERKKIAKRARNKSN